MSAHTPGPWKVYPAVYREGSIQVGANGMAVCEIYADRDWSTTAGHPFDDQGRRDADARLIAAAPELLEALRAVTAYYEGQPMPFFGKAVKAAIAKAEDAS